MTAREARNRRRAEERKEAKLARKAGKSANQLPVAGDSAPPPVSAARFNPELEGEFPRELQIQANLVRDRIHQRAESNRLNARHSTGPKSPEGKLASSRNSLKHGLASGQILIPGEDPAAFEALLHDLIEEHQPGNTTEDLLVHEMAQSHWLAQRAIRCQNDCFTETGIDEKRLSLFLRYQTTHGRAFHKALNMLMKLKKERGRRHADEAAVFSKPKTQADEASVSSKPKTQADEAAALSEPKSQVIGFVSQNTPPERQFARQNEDFHSQSGSNLQKSEAA